MSGWQLQCYGWGRFPTTVAALLIGWRLGVAFERREGDFLGPYYLSEGTDVEVRIVDNFWCGSINSDCGGKPQKEPDYPEHHTLVYLEGENRETIERYSGLLRSIPRMKLLYTLSS